MATKKNDPFNLEERLGIKKNKASSQSTSKSKSSNNSSYDYGDDQFNLQERLSGNGSATGTMAGATPRRAYINTVADAVNRKMYEAGAIDDVTFKALQDRVTGFGGKMTDVLRRYNTDAASFGDDRDELYSYELGSKSIADQYAQYVSARLGNTSVLEGKKGQEKRVFKGLNNLSEHDKITAALAAQNGAQDFDELYELSQNFNLQDAMLTVEDYYRGLYTPVMSDGMSATKVDRADFAKAASDIKRFTGVDVRGLKREEVEQKLSEIGDASDTVEWMQNYMRWESERRNAEAALGNWKEDFTKNWGSLRDAPDYDELSSVEKKKSFWNRNPYADVDYLHPSEVYPAQAFPETYSGVFDYMDEQQLRDFTYLYNQPDDGEAQAKAYLEALAPELLRQRAEDQVKKAVAFADQNGWTGTAAFLAARGANLANSIAGATDMLASPFRAVAGLVDPSILENDPNSTQYDYVRYAQALDNANIRNIAEATPNMSIAGINIPSQIYSGAASGADSLAAGLLYGPYGGAALGANAYSAARYEGEDMLDANMRALFEGLTEKYSLDAKFKDTGSIIKSIAKNMLVEPTEELANMALNIGWDRLRYGENDEIGKRFNELRAKGYDEHGASIQIASEYGREALATVISSAFAGAMGGTVGGTTNAIENRTAGKNLQSNNEEKSVLDLATTLPLPEDVMKIAKEQLGALAEGAQTSAAKIGRVFREMMKVVDEKTQSVVSETMRRKLDKSLKADGIDDPEMADAVTRIIADNGTATTEDYKRVASNDKALALTEGLVARYDDAVQLNEKAARIAEAAAKKAQKDQTKQPADVPEGEQPADVVTGEEQSESAAEADELAAAGIPTDAEAVKGMIREEVQDLVEQDAESVVSAYEEGQDPVAYATEFRRAMQFGEEGRNFGVISKSDTLTHLTEQQIAKAYTMGRGKRVFNAEQSVKNRKGMVKVGNVDTKEIRDMKLTGEQGAAIDTISRLAKVIGFNVKFVARTFDAEGNATSRKNGEWQKSTRTITIDINAGRLTRDSANYAIMQTAGHELTHFIKAFADSELWNQYQDFVIGHMSEKLTEADLDNRINDLIERYKKAGQTLDRDSAMEEIVADASGDALLKLTEADIQQMAEQNPSLLKKIGEFIQKWVSEVKTLIEEAYKGQKVRNQFAEQMTDVVDELGAKWTELLKNAAQHARMAEGEDVAVNAQEEVKLSLQEDERLMQKAIDMNASKGNVDDGVLEEAAESRSKVADFMRDDSRDLNLPEDLMGNTFFSDAAYGGSEENTTVCPRSIGADAFLDAVSDNLGRPLTVAEQVRISQDIIGAADIKEPQCIYCYVAADRAAYREFLGKYIDQRDSVIDALKNGETDLKQLYETFLNGRKDTPNMKKRFDLWVKSYRDGKRMLSASDLSNIGVLTAIQSDKYKQLNGDPNFAAQMKDALAYAQSASWAKKRVDYVAYNGHILKWTQNRVNKLNSMYGLRMYSFSDFSPAFALENMQMVTDASVRGLKMLAYTKVPAFAEIFADTNMNINVSVFATEVKGDSGSSIVENNLMGADWKAAQKLRSEHENIGVTFVATSDAQVEWALDQDWIDVVIPYHLVRTGRTIAEMMKYKNYTAESGDAKKSGWSKGSNLSSIPAALHNNDRDTYMRLLEENNLEPRFARFVDHPNYMKLVNETRQSVTTSKPVQPIFNTDAAINALQDMANNGGYYVPVGGSQQRMYELASEFAGKVQAGEYQTDIAEDDVRFSVEEGILTEESTEQERYELLKDATVTLSEVNADRLAEAEVNFNGMRTAEAARTVKVIAKKLGVNNLNLSNSQLNMEFDYSLGNVGESASKQKNYGGNYDDLVKALTCIEQLAFNAVPIEVHSDKKSDTKKANPDLKNVYVLVSAFADGDGYVPVQMEVKEYYNRASGLYMSVTLNKIKPDVVSERRLSDDQKGLTHLLSGSKVSIAEIFKNVNPDTDERFLKYVPDGFLNGEQRAAKQRALGKQTAEYASYQLQDPTQITDREILANLMDNAAENEAELDFVRRYRKQIEQLNEKQAQLDETNAAIVEARKNKANRDEIFKLQNKADILGKQIDRMDGKLLSFEAGKPLQAVVARERAALKRKADERVKAYAAKRVETVKKQEAEKREKLNQKLAEVRQKRDEKLAQLRKEKTEAVEKMRDQKNESFGRQKYLKQVNEAVNALREMVTTPTDKKHVPDFLRKPLGEFLDALDFTSVRQLNGGEPTNADAKILSATLAMRTAIEKVRKQQSGLQTSGSEFFNGYLDITDAYIEEFDNVMAKVRTAIDVASNLNDAPINKMDSDTLHELVKCLRTLKTAINQMNQMQTNAQFAHADACSLDTITFLGRVKEKNAQNKLMQKAADFIDWKNTTPYYAFKRFGKGGRSIFESLQNGWDRLAFNADEVIKFTEKTYKSEEVKAWESEIKTIELSSGKTVQMSVAQVMCMYNLARRRQAMGHLMGGGIRVETIDGKLGKSIVQTENYTLSEADIDTFRSYLSERQIEVADALQQYAANRGAEMGNEVSMRRFGYEMFTEENYWPVESDSNNMAAKDQNAHENSLLRLLNMSATKGLTKDANNAIVVRSVFDVFTDHTGGRAAHPKSA